MDNHKGTLEATYEVKNLASRYRYDKNHQEWSPQENMGFFFSVKDEGKNGVLKVSLRDVNPEDIKAHRVKLKESSDLFLLYLNFLSGSYDLNHKEISLRFFNNCFDETMSDDIDIDHVINKIKNKGNIKKENSISIEMSGIISLVGGFSLSCQLPLPDFSTQYCPSLTKKLKRHLITYIQTQELGEISQKYPDDMLKRWFLILEEIEENTGNIDYQNIKRARHFVSHSMCDTKSGRKVIDFLKRELAEAVYTNSENNEEARFDRGNQKHIEFVQKYAVKAEERARQLLMQQLEQHHD